MRERKARKKNGFDKPWNSYQLGLWCYFGLEQLVFHLRFGIFGEFSLPLSVVINSSHVILAIVSFCCAWIATSKDVADQLLQKSHGQSIKDMRNKVLNSNNNSSAAHPNGSSYLGVDIADLKFCDFCFGFVHKNSKHCRACDRCTEGFDHHCQFLNNCVSDGNYSWFFSSLMIYTILTTFHLILSIITLHSNIIIGDWKHPLLYPMFVHCLLLFIVILPMYQLLGFHVYLQMTGQSTYSFIKDKQQRRQNKEEEKASKNDDDNDDGDRSPEYHQSSNVDTTNHQTHVLSMMIITIPVLRLSHWIRRVLCLPFIPQSHSHSHKPSSSSSSSSSKFEKNHLNRDDHRKTHPSDLDAATIDDSPHLTESNHSNHHNNLANMHNDNNNNNNADTSRKKYSLDHIELHRITVNPHHPNTQPINASGIPINHNPQSPDTKSETLETSVEPSNFTLAVLN